MVFGFALVMLAGCLVTAVRNRTGMATPTGERVTALARLRITGRVIPTFNANVLPAARPRKNPRCSPDWNGGYMQRMMSGSW
ncbi:MAG: NnrS family protein [Alphaproteobacteria bacterium]|nr:NnrS family protein [Alphaproteobacteria bacterium]